MSQERPTIQSFKDLVAWQKAHALVVKTYEVTVSFPKAEQFGLTNQVRRAAVSIVSNIAEGFGRRTGLDRVRFYDMARASLHEVQAQMIVAKDIGFLPEDTYNTFEEGAVEVHKLLTGLINKTRSLNS
jgi:four helix bundle protein